MLTTFKSLTVLTCMLVLSACGGGSKTTANPVNPIVNNAPVVNAGVDATTRLPDTRALDGTVSDDGLPAGATVSTAWSVASGPAGATFADLNAVDTTVTFVSEGTYVLQLTANDTALQANDSVTITVQAAPVLSDVVVTPSTAALTSGGTQQFVASGTDQYGDVFPVVATWSATGGLIDVDGIYTAGFIAGSFVVTATDGSVSKTASVSIDTAPAAPASVTASGEDNQVSLDWADNSEPDIAGYNVWRSETQGGGYAKIAGPVIASAYIDTLVTNGTLYYYVVSAEDAIANVSDFSAEVVAIPNPPAVAYWRLDEGTGTAVADSAGISDGTIVGAAWAAGISSNALDFNGSGDHVGIDVNTPALDITGTQITLGAWIYPRDGASTQRVISKRTDTPLDEEVYAMIIQNYRLVFKLDAVDMTSSHIIRLDDWVHVVMVYDGIDKRIYVNGVLDVATPQAKVDTIDASLQSLQLGRRDDNTRFFDGKMDEVRVYDRALSADEVALQYASVVPPAATPGLSFTDIANPSIAAPDVPSGTAGPVSGGQGIMFAEVDNDSLPDLYLTYDPGTLGASDDFFFVNVDGAVFADDAEAGDVRDTDGGSQGAVWADLDNDGDYDLYNGSARPSSDPALPVNNNVYANNGLGVFTDVTPADILATANDTRGVTAFDMDNDGDLDLFAVSSPTSGVSEAYLNGLIGGAGSFDFSSHLVGGDLTSVGIAMQGVIATDYDGDGWIDILAANRGGEFAILHNDGIDGPLGLRKFSLISPATLGITDGDVDGIPDNAGDGITTADVDNDGDLDLLLVSNSPARGYLYLRDGGLYVFKQTFFNVEGYMGAFADLDNDGDLDVVFGGDERVFLNDGTGTFSSGQSVPVDEISDPRGIAFADIEGDGDL
ncbi:MAG: FG-GAP-like repeat-containing protein, partial [Woeseiaceae bacterium]|nr:FG-GAP-like repeat-containing protein [Woeseiaceae bacterium]